MYGNRSFGGRGGYGLGGAASPLAARGNLVRPGTPGVRTPAPPLVVQTLNPGHNDDMNADMTNGGVTARRFDVNRVIQAGGRLATEILPESLIPFEQLYRRQPAEGMFDPGVSPARPFVFEMGVQGA